MDFFFSFPLNPIGTLRINFENFDTFCLGSHFICKLNAFPSQEIVGLPYHTLNITTNVKLARLTSMLEGKQGNYAPQFPRPAELTESKTAWWATEYVVVFMMGWSI